MRRIPILPTLIVLAAVAVMIRLGFWQIDRMHEKAAMLARYHRAQAMSSLAPWPRTVAAQEAALYRMSSLRCARPLALVPRAGHNQRGETGWMQVVRCALADGGAADVAIGWSRQPGAVRLESGTVSVDAGPGVSPRFTSLAPQAEYRGIVAPAGKGKVTLIVTAPPPGLAANAAPDPADIPNNHWSYAVQWFLFAAVALVIYALALAKRLAAASPRR